MTGSDGSSALQADSPASAKNSPPVDVPITTPSPKGSIALTESPSPPGKADQLAPPSLDTKHPSRRVPAHTEPSAATASAWTDDPAGSPCDALRHSSPPPRANTPPSQHPAKRVSAAALQARASTRAFSGPSKDRQLNPPSSESRIPPPKVAPHRRPSPASTTSVTSESTLPAERAHRSPSLALTLWNPSSQCTRSRVPERVSRKSLMKPSPSREAHDEPPSLEIRASSKVHRTKLPPE